MSDSFKLAIAWLIAGSLGFVLILQHSSFLDSQGQYVFFDTDSFYHATRILHALNSNEFYQYDTRVGQWISLPWAYDWLLAQGLRLLLWIKSDIDSVAVLAYVPAIFVFVNALLVIAIAAAIELPVFFCLLAALCFVLLPTTHHLHAVGRIDHHYLEHSCTLAALLAGIQFYKYPQNKKYALLLGCILGASLGVHNELFLLQLPLLCTAGVRWLAKERTPSGSPYLVAALLITTMLVTIPSDKFRQGEFSFYFLSWFQVYIACCSALLLMLLAKISTSRENIVKLAVLVVLLIVPVLSDVVYGVKFVTANLYNLRNVTETASPLKDIKYTISIYSALLLLAPFAWFYLCVGIKANINSYKLYLVIFMLFGLVFTLQQYRFIYYGSYVLYLPILLLAHDFLQQFKTYGLRITAGLLALLAVCFVPAYKDYREFPLGGSLDFEILYPAYAAIQRVCAEDPGLILADWNEGHYITYYSNCSITANPMFITPEDFNHIAENKRLMNVTANELLEQNAYPVKYVFVRQNYNVPDGDKVLTNELLFSNALPSNFRLMFMLSTGNTPIAGLYKLVFP